MADDGALNDADIEALASAARDEMGLDRWPADRRDGAFGEVGDPDAEVRLARAGLLAEVGELIRAGRVSCDDAARAFGVDAPELDAMLSGDRSGLTLDGTVRALAALGYRVATRLRTVPTVERG